MSGWYIVYKDGRTTPVHNLATGIYYVKSGEADKVVDQYSGRVIVQK
jgi:oxalate decarboxylase/phosphoglucose isomerase-like protein (cupin superfamily)